METYDTIIVGAGPAGGQCARELAQQGFKVLLLDKAKSFEVNNYSSGGAPHEIMSMFDLPDSIIGSCWYNLRVQSTQSKATWTSPTPFGPVLDFDKLRLFLANETLRGGGDVRLGWQFQNYQIHSHAIEVSLKDLESQTSFTVQTSSLVDATGSERRVLAQQSYDKQQAILATGIEYHIQVSPEIYEKYAQALNFFLGHYWMPQGYAWIFPMAAPQLKVGVIRYFQNKNYVPHHPSYKPYLEQLLNTCGTYKICDKHGKTIYYTKAQRDVRYRGAVIAIGDAISSINPLGWEGIRHAMVSGRLAAQALQRYLKGETKDFRGYDQAIHQYFGYKWFYTEWLMSYLFRLKQDFLIDKAVRSLSRINNEEMMQILFHYQIQRTLKSYVGYLTSRLKELWMRYV